MVAAIFQNHPQLIEIKSMSQKMHHAGWNFSHSDECSIGKMHESDFPLGEMNKSFTDLREREDRRKTDLAAANQYLTFYERNGKHSPHFLRWGRRKSYKVSLLWMILKLMAGSTEARSGFYLIWNQVPLFLRKDLGSQRISYWDLRSKQ